MVLRRTRQISHSSWSALSSPGVGGLALPGFEGPGFAGAVFPFRRRSSRNATIATAATGIATPRTIPSGNGAVGRTDSLREGCPTKNSVMFGASRSFAVRDASFQFASIVERKEKWLYSKDDR